MSSTGPTLMDHVTDPRNRGILEDATCTGRASLGGTPPYVTLSLKVRDDIVAIAKFEAFGCGYTIACCSVVTEMVIGKSLTACAALLPSNVLDELAGLPEHRRFCATLAIEALQDALRQCRESGHQARDT